jgi:hypothetical protein
VRDGNSRRSGTGPLKVSSYSTQLQWLDPVGVPTVVQSAALPADVPLCTFGTAKPGVGAQVLTLSDQFENQFGEPSGGSG